jgi:hypothetical protein
MSELQNLYKFIYFKRGSIYSDYCLFTAKDMIDARQNILDFISDNKYIFKEVDRFDVSFVGKFATITKHLSFHYGLYTDEELKELDNE